MVEAYRYRGLVFLGPPGAGKGTQASRAARQLRIPHVATGDMIRMAVEQRTPAGIKARRFFERGELVPDEILLQMVSERLAREDCRPGVILDGFPRNLGQAEWLDAELRRTGRQLVLVLALEVEDEALVQRLGGRRTCPRCQRAYHPEHAPPVVSGRCDADGAALVQRPDDEAEAIRTRLRVYHEQTAPLLDYYRRAQRLVEVSGVGGIEAVERAVQGALERVR
jgi:adenylate kinase